MDNSTLIAMLERKAFFDRQKCFDSRDLQSRPNHVQQQVLNDIDKYSERYVIAGNQCLAEGTLVATPAGPKAIEDIVPGDTVYSENGEEIKVLKVFDNGKKEVVEILHRGSVWAEATKNHVWLTTNSSYKIPRTVELPIEKFSRDTQIVRQEIKPELGPVYVQDSYAIGALLGDGCSTISGVVISSDSHYVPNKVAELSGSEAYSNKYNYSWRIKGAPKISYYAEWCKGRKAHEKIADLNIIKTWDRKTLLAYVAGILDTDGSVFVDGWGNVCLSVEMQALPVIESIQYAMLALWQYPANIIINNRPKYKNGPTYTIRAASNAFSVRMLRELDKYIQTPRKKFKQEYLKLESKRSSPTKIGARSGKSRITNVYDIHVDSPTNLYLLANGLVTHNCGKTQLGAREAAWVFSGTHPSWTPPDRPLLMLIVGQSNKAVKEELWESKMKPFLDEGTYKEKIVGGALSGAVHANGNRILFFSHNSPDECRKLVQGYVADWVWLDEMPGSFRLLSELHTRCQANKAPFLATFTPLLKNAEIKNYIENKSNKFIKKYSMTVHDNPIYLQDKDKYDKLKMRLSGMSESERATREAGAWYVGDNAVYDFSTERHVEKPEHYDKSWRHLEAVDPAASGKAGYALLAEDPNTGVWYTIRVAYIKGKAPSVLLSDIMAMTGNVNLVKRVCDSHEAWYIKEANLHKIWYEIPHKKTERKKELIKGLQEALYSGKLKVAPWCDKAIDEFTTCQWSENGSERIVNSSSFHILDCLQYAVDCLPKLQEEKKELTFRQELKRKDEIRRAKEAGAAKALEKKPARFILKQRRRQRKIWGR